MKLFGWLSRRKQQRQRYPRPLDTFFEEGCCPDCGSKKSSTWKDGGHDLAMQCDDCGSKFGINLPPLSTIERIGVKG